MITQDDWNRLARFAAGECTPEEAEAFERWVDAAPERRGALAFIQNVDGAAEVGCPQWDTTTAWERLAARRSVRSRPPLRLTPSWAGRQAPWWLRSAAAAAMLLVAGSLAGLWQYARVRSAETAAAGMMREYVTTRGQRATFQLPDGSLVVLGAASRLRYPTSFDAPSGRRDVYLEGQALFEVHHDERRPFLVHTARAITEDLGTRFMVQEYRGDTTMQVVVAEGRVALRARGQAAAGALLTAGQLGRLDAGATVTVQRDVDLGRYLAWTEGRLVFDNTPLRDALPQLSRWYDLDFRMGDSTLADLPLTATFRDQPTPEMLELLTLTLGVRRESRGRSVVLYAK